LSIPLPAISLANLSVGQSGVVSFANIGISAGGVSSNPVNVKSAGTILIYNESGSGLLIKFQLSGSGFYLPAGAWQPIQIGAGETGYQWTIIYNLPSPPVTQLLTSYYYPGEPIPPQPTLGNSPIGIGGTVTTSSVQTLSNETNTVPTLVIDIGQVGNTQQIVINSDGSATWNVIQSGTPVLAFSIANNLTNPITLNKPALRFPVLQSTAGNNLGLLAGSISRMIVDGPFNIRLGGTTVNHSLGVIPDFIWCISDTGGIGTAAYYAVNFGTLSSTQATIYCSNDNGGSGTRTWIMSFKA